ncbi:MAG: hydrogenase expression/formation protein HypE [Candidatus Margulisbacteria bacterium GWF2_35_9]|nr:MAG: hydrogenase expression/formation protein HypE [Candidatus Margulisbacteria bacterium GWF2_35_9]
MTKNNNEDIIILDHGSGGQLSQELIRNVFLKHFGKSSAAPLADSAILSIDSNKIAMTTDSYVVQPIFFPGGNIGKLAICGTVNDLSVVGAKPCYLSCGFIIEEGLPISDLELIVKSMADEASKCGVTIVTGDTKVVERGSCDKIFINTTGIGTLMDHCEHISSGSKIQPGDKIIINGTIADHGMAVISKRNGLEIEAKIESDCAGLNYMIEKILKYSKDIHFMRDATRGGLATVLCECVENRSFGVKLDEENIPVNEAVEGVCELLGFDPLYVANEGKLVAIVSSSIADDVLAIFKKDALGKSARIIGEITSENKSMVVMKTGVGGHRLISMLSGGQLPRIC